MVTRIFFFLVGFGMMTIGFTYLISYLNLFTFGYRLADYLKFIITRYECYYTIVGFIIINLTVFVKGKKHDLCK